MSPRGAGSRRSLGGRLWSRVGPGFLPFADAASADLPLSRLLRLSLFQVTVGMAMALTIGTLNRVMIVELAVPAALVSVMVALPMVFAPLRAFIGFKSDTHRSYLGWRRVPYIWFGTLMQFGGLAIMPFALLVLSGDSGAPVAVGQVAAAVAFLLIGAGMQTTQTAGLALATDLAPEEARPRVVALMFTMLLVGVVVSGFAFSLLLADFSPMRLIQVVQGAAALTMAVNLVALWKQEARDPGRTRGRAADDPDFRTTWRLFTALPGRRRFLLAVALGTVAFAMQDPLLEPYGGEVLGMGVGQTTMLTALMAAGALAAFAVAARVLVQGFDPCRLAAYGLVMGLPAFTAVLLAAPLDSPGLFRVGAILIGFGSGLVSVGTLSAAMNLEPQARTGLALGAWGAVQATAAGVGIGLAGVIRDGISNLAERGALGPALDSHATGYGSVYYLEILLILAALVVIGPLARLTDKVAAGGPKALQDATPHGA
ncbi:MFS transporter [Zavarzinia sp. CC-PAN008]|uniref:MFS transporter n=1 Tax=Zavarzinia sp. CC-PAN008 TaxID=3243332 RepID=UPI003F744CFC